jgi:2-polyprenyl-6-methoxyphenol hydroxylase-like FAD-dependent oxidoreductase
MHRNGIFLAGDAAHAYPPSGGFGMNSGFQDINELVHALFLVSKNKQINSQYIFNNYSQNRRNINLQYLKKSL